MQCNLCPRKCNAVRTEETNENGFCKMPLLPKVARAALHFWEEPCISGKNGSGTVFFSGCSLGCVYCQNEEISHGGKGENVTYDRLAEIFRELESQGAHNINLVTPTHYIPAIINAFEIYRPRIPVVYNGSGYESVEALRLIEPYIDIYLLDFKYFSSERAFLYSGAADYPETAKQAISFAYSKKQKPSYRDGIMTSGLIIRHLLLPQGTKDAMAVFDWVRVNTPGATFSLMSQYIPCGKAKEMPPLDRRVTAREYDKVIDYMASTGFEAIYIQERDSADQRFIPPFDGSGVSRSTKR